MLHFINLTVCTDLISAHLLIVVIGQMYDLKTCLAVFKHRKSIALAVIHPSVDEKLSISNHQVDHYSASH